MKNSNPDDTKKYASMRLWKKRWYRITSFLAAVVVFCTTYALILPAVTQERTVTQDSGVSVSGITIGEITDGEGPFDGDSEAGNDSDNTNRIVRTFDTVKYKFTVSTAGTPYDNARVKMEFILPLTENEAEFDVAAMGWMDTTDGYKYYLENQTRNINGTDTNCQVLTCYKHLQKTVASTAAIPGSFTETFTVKVKAMKNGDTIQPTITASLELNLAQCVEKTADPVTVSAAPRYNVKLDGGPIYKDTFDFSTGNSLAKQYGDGYITETSKKDVVGRAMKFGVTLQLYNDGTANKGFKGIEIPTGPITFDLKLTSKYGAAESTATDVTNDYTPLLWSCDYNSPSWEDKTNNDGRELTKDFSGSAYEYAPWTSGPEIWYSDDKTCYRGGGWSATQVYDTISVRVSNYGIDVNKMPTKNGEGAKEIYNLANGEGCFSSGEIWIVQPFNKTDGTPPSGTNEYGILENGTGMFYTTVEVQNLKSTSIGGTEFNDSDGTNDAQMNQSDDKKILTLPLYLEGSLTNRIAYRNDNTSDKGVGVDDPYDGKDFATPGTEFYILSGLDYTDNGEPDNQLYWATNFTRINADIFEVMDEAPTMTCKQDDKPVSADKYTVLYVGDDKNWQDEWNLQAATEDWRTYYTSLEELKRDNKKCIGVLYCVKGPLEGNISFVARLPVKVREELTAEQIGQAYMTVSTSRAWTKAMYVSAGKEIPDINIWTGEYQSKTLDNLFPTGYYQIANIKGVNWGWYKKEIYQSDGSASEPHNSIWSWFGDTLLVIKFKSQINKTLLQTLPDGSEKTTFNLDANQRIVDFKLQPETVLDNQLSSNLVKETTVTIVDTLPKYLNYVSGSANIGGTYTQTSVNGGTQGTVTGGTQIISADENAAPSNVGDATLFIKKNEDGTTTLTWKVKCKIGESIKPIYYSVEIGDRYDASNDIDVGTTPLPYNVRIYAAGEDLREPTAANKNYAQGSITAVRGNAFSFGKFTKNETVEPNGVIDYTVYYDNISTAQVNVKLMDVMPADGINGSQFSGSYTVQSFKFDTTKCDVANLELYYTDNPNYKNATTVDDNVIKSSWTPATINEDGTVTAMNGSAPVAWAVLGPLESSKSVNINLQIKLNDPSTPKFTYVDFDSTAANTFYNNSDNNNGAKVVPSDDGHGNSIYFTQTSNINNTNPHSIAVSNLDGTGMFKIEQGKKYTLSYDYRFELVNENLNAAAVFAPEGKTAGELGTVQSYSDDAHLCYLWSNTSGEWVSKIYSFEAPYDGNIFIVPFTWSEDQPNQKIWFDNIKIEEIQDNKYINTVISGSGANSTTQQTQAPTPIIRRSIEGLTWLDRDSDGVQNDGSNRYISGVKVSLLKLKVGGNPESEMDYEVCYYADRVTPVTVETGKQVSVISQGSATDYIPGRYRFMDLPEGIYAVKFEDGSGKTKISPLIASPANRGEDDTLDSDGIAVYKEDRSELLRTYILNINMPAAANMESSYIYESKNNDSGFYKRGYELPKSGGKGTDTYTYLGLTIWGFAFLSFVYRKARKTFGKSK